jgi:hypothetical protein
MEEEEGEGRREETNQFITTDVIPQRRERERKSERIVLKRIRRAIPLHQGGTSGEEIQTTRVDEATGVGKNGARGCGNLWRRYEPIFLPPQRRDQSSFG